MVVTDRGRRVAALQPFDASMTGRPLPDREAAIRKRSRVPVGSRITAARVVYNWKSKPAVLSGNVQVAQDSGNWSTESLVYNVKMDSIM